MKIVPIILAGGSGTRFWPLSRKKSPKQVLNLSGKDTLIGEAISRFSTVTPEENIYISASADSCILVRKALTDQSKVNYITEPTARGTSACILLAALKLHKSFGDAVLCVSPSDHSITKEDQFTKIILEAIESAKSTDSIVTIGINPSFPSTAYGYIGCDYSRSHGQAFAVSEFTEKPPVHIAKSYLEKGNFFWNSGIFVFRTSVIIENFKRFVPKIYDRMMECYDVFNTERENELLSKIYPTLQNISIDYGVIERSKDVFVIPADMGWSDIGSWDSLGSLFPPDENDNTVKAKAMLIDTKNCVVFSDKALVATVGIENMIIVSTDDAILVCPKNQDQRVREIVKSLKENNMESFL